ncbi:MAG: hypothetical protein J6Z07_00705 [Lachnospiraceae bacterium]|nr:hypothetical protein [Clostridiales bacterium]MBP5275301.1 hypothetical protein [Lachnospiraceae bacterium]
MNTKFRALVADTMASLADITSKEASVINEVIDFVQDAEAISKRVNSLESDADMIVHTFNLQIRENEYIMDEQMKHYFGFISYIEECTDVIEDLAIAFNSFNITSLREDYIPSLIAVEQAAEVIVNLVGSMRNPNKRGLIQNAIIDLNHCRDEGVRMYSESMRNLFTYEKDAIEIIRWKEIYTLTRDIFIAFEDFADSCEEYILKYS